MKYECENIENDSIIEKTLCDDRYVTDEYEVFPGISIMYYTSHTQNGIL